MFDILAMLGQCVCFFILHVRGSGSFPKPLSEKRERELLELMKQGDSAARNELIEHNLRLVAHIIKKYYNDKSERHGKCNLKDRVSYTELGQESDELVWLFGVVCFGCLWLLCRSLVSRICLMCNINI